jgi:hypothetical protein
MSAKESQQKYTIFLPLQQNDSVLLYGMQRGGFCKNVVPNANSGALGA